MSQYQCLCMFCEIIILSHHYSKTTYVCYTQSFNNRSMESGIMVSVNLHLALPSPNVYPPPPPPMHTGVLATSVWSACRCSKGNTNIDSSVLAVILMPMDEYLYL